MKKIIAISLLFGVFGCYQAARKAFTIKNLGKDTSFQIKASSNPKTVIIRLCKCPIIQTVTFRD
jgi:hypothetical protein